MRHEMDWNFCHRNASQRNSQPSAKPPANKDAVRGTVRDSRNHPDCRLSVKPSVVKTPDLARTGAASNFRKQIVPILIAALFWSSPVLRAADLSEEEVKQAIDRGKKFLIQEQSQDGSWQADADIRVGIGSLCVLALLNSGMSPQDPPVRRGLQYLRSRSPEDYGGRYETYQVSLLIMALSAARDRSDAVKIADLAQRLENGQITADNTGAWAYGLGNSRQMGGDQSNTQFAILGLREAVEAGASVSRQTWELARDYWERNQNNDGGWGYMVGGLGNLAGKPPSRGSMTVAGISSLSICQQMLKSDAGVAADGTPPCCDDVATDKAIENGINWLARAFSVHQNPGIGGNQSLLYYIYGVERAGRLSGQRFFGDHDWYREGTAMLLAIQNPVDGHWTGTGTHETHPVYSTSLALLFVSKGLAPVLINKLKYGTRHLNNPNILLDNNWNRHPRDVRNLTELVSSMPKWPKLLTTQDLDLARAVKSGGVNTLLQAPVLFITGPTSLSFTPAETKLLKEYLEEGGFIFACPTCQNTEFEPSFRELVKKLLPPGEGELKPLTPDHPVYRIEHPLQPEGVKLLGVDFGCRTSIMYSPEDLACLWDYWAKVDPPKRNVQLKAKIVRATQIGVNVLAYATGREPPDKTQVRQVAANEGNLDHIERGLLQIAQIKHEGAWNAAPRALRNLLMALNETVGLSASTKMRDLTLSDKNIFRYPVLYMHGRNRFSIPPEERQQLKTYLDRGGILVADSCCGAKQFDKAFRECMLQLYPNKKLERIPVSHELFSDKIGRDIKLLKRRTSEGNDANSGGNMTIRSAEPILEGIELDGRFAVIYSRFDISCALERQNSGNCEGYLPEDAVKLGTNIILYAMLQNLRFNPADQ